MQAGTRWTVYTDIEVVQTDFPMRAPPLSPQRSRGAFVPAPGVPPQTHELPPNLWGYKWQLRCLSPGQADVIIDGLTTARQVVSAWQQLLTSVNLVP